MRLFIHLKDGQPHAWPLTGTDVKYLAPEGTGFPSSSEAYEAVDLAEFGFETFAEAAKPVFDAATQKVVDTTPVQIDGVWTRQWSVVNLDASEINSKVIAAAAAARLAAIDAVLAADATLATAKAMTNAEFDAWWAANVTNLAQASNVLKRIARVVIRRVL